MSIQSPRAPLLEVFASIQGEGLFLGEPQVFLRLAGCPLRCRYCDTPESWPLPRPQVRSAAPTSLRGVVGERTVLEPHSASEPQRDTGLDDELPSGWVTPFGAACRVAEAEPGRPRTVSVTGGEPLVWPEFVASLPGFLGARRLHLETAGAHPDALEQVLPACDHVSLDLKAGADLDRPVRLGEVEVPRNEEEWAAARAACLTLLAGRDACGKLVVTGGTRLAHYTALLDEVLEHAPELPVFVQPATALRGVRAPALAELEAVVEAALDRELAVRAVPQVHRFLGVR